jgi:magnesium transporter
MEGQLLLDDGTTKTAGPEEVKALLKTSESFWLDLTSLDPEAISLLSGDLHIHPLSIEDMEHLGQRPKLDTYENYVHLVLHGAKADLTGTDEVHALYSETFLVTYHPKPLDCLAALRTRAAALRKLGKASGIFLLYRVVDALVDSFFPMLDVFDDTIDALEDKILEAPTEEQLGELFAMKRTLVGLRKVVTPERDVFAGVAARALELPGMTDDAERYFRDIYDHLIRISDLVDSYRDLLTGAVDTHLSVVSNRLNAVMKQLTIIATIFLPLSFLTGFFGQNFGFLVTRIGSTATFFGLGLGLELLAVVLLLAMFKRRKWL